MGEVGSLMPVVSGLLLFAIRCRLFLSF